MHIVILPTRSSGTLSCKARITAPRLNLINLLSRCQRFSKGPALLCFDADPNHYLNPDLQPGNVIELKKLYGTKP